MQKSKNKSIFVNFHKSQVQMVQGPQLKTRYTESNRRESGKETRTHWHEGREIY